MDRRTGRPLLDGPILARACELACWPAGEVQKLLWQAMTGVIHLPAERDLSLKEAEPRQISRHLQGEGRRPQERVEMMFSPL